MNKLATLEEMVEDLRKDKELRKRLDRKAIWALLNQVEKGKTASQQTA